jgi:hypothetical protein
MVIDCAHCQVRGVACGDCVVSVVLGAAPDGVEIDEEQRVALEVLALGGLVPRLRLLSGSPADGPTCADPPAGGVVAAG